MAIYDKHADSPERLKNEAEDITLKLVRNGDGTATIKWNIPSISGCSVEDLIYDGIVVTVSSRPANYISSSPQNGEYYDADTTFDSDLHTGDKINVASVVGAFYHDRTTTEITVTDVANKTPYYVSAYAVDQVGNYYRQGVHAYSLPTGESETDKSGPEQPAFHDLQIDTPEGITVKTRTGLAKGATYTFRVEINGDCYSFDDLRGSDMQTYEDIASVLNKRLKLLVKPILGPNFPNTGKFQVDESNKKVYQWDGSQNIEQDAIFLDEDPALPVIGTYWYKPSTKELRIRETAGWALVSAIIEFATDPSNPSDGTVWLDKVLESNGGLDATNTTAWVWEAGTWCKRNTIIQVRNPLLPPILSSGTYWYNETDGTVSGRNVDGRKWDEVDPIVWDTDPNTISDGDFWYSGATELAFVRIAGEWSDVTNIRYEATEPTNPVANHYWFDTTEQRLYQRNGANDAWVEINVVIAATDPATRESCDLWWNVDVGIDTLFKWDDVNNEWDEVDAFFQSVDDPASPSALPGGTIWYNPETEVMQQITGLNCSNVSFICSMYDPSNLPIGVVWLNTADGTFFIWDGVEFVSIEAIRDEDDPYGVSDGILWFDGDDDQLFLREVGAWVEQVYSRDSLASEVDTYFFNTVEDELYQWNGTMWLVSCGLASVELLFDRAVCFDNVPNINIDQFGQFNDFDKFGRDIVRFKTCATGCDQRIEVDSTQSDAIFVKINKPVIRYAPATGRSTNNNGPMYRELGVGTDGSPDERRKLQEQIRVALGTVSTTVELTKQQLDECIDNSLLMVRKYSSYSYEHVLFFLDVLPNQQKYSLTNACVGFNKIVNINAVHRMRGGFLGTGTGGFGGNDIYGYAALQQLYSLGTFDMLSYHMVSSYIEDLQYLFADQLVYTFYEDNRTLSFHQIFYSNERVMLDAFIEVSEQKLITNRYLSLWIKKWAIAEAKMMLSHVRGKYQSLPGPNGSTTLNSQELITQAENEKVELREELFDRSMQDHNADVQSQFFIG
jgi:hypothetical protein